MAPKVVAVVDLQFGSTGKGLIAGYLSVNGLYYRRCAKTLKFSAAVTNWGPNAGHTSMYEDGRAHVRTMLANSAIKGTVNTVYVGPGSVVNIDALIKETWATVDARRAYGNKSSLTVVVHEHAAVVTDEMRNAESRHNKIGSTQKGTAEAWIAKMNRNEDGAPCLAKHFIGAIQLSFDEVRIVVVSHAEYVQRLYREEAVLAEGCQGYSLGFSSGFWPHVTARECTVAQLLADTCLPPSSLAAVVGCARTFPIRVANRYDADGQMVGWSGPGYPDQEEISFEQLGVPTEYTTVTKLPRRVFTFSEQQFSEAIAVNGCTDVFLNFMNYYRTEEAMGIAFGRASRIANRHGAIIRYVGHGPSTADIKEEW